MQPTGFAESTMNSVTSSAAAAVTTNTFLPAVDAVTSSIMPASRWALCKPLDQSIRAAHRTANGARHDGSCPTACRPRGRRCAPATCAPCLCKACKHRPDADLERLVAEGGGAWRMDSSLNHAGRAVEPLWQKWTPTRRGPTTRSPALPGRRVMRLVRERLRLCDR